MRTNGGGWTIIQRRLDGSVDFYRNWDEFKKGFGSKSGEYWLGLQIIHLMTSRVNYTLRIELESFSGEKRFAEYKKFHIAGEDENYRLTVGRYSGKMVKLVMIVVVIYTAILNKIPLSEKNSQE